MINPLFTDTVPVLRRHGVTVEHQHHDSNDGDNTLHIDNMTTPITFIGKWINKKR